MHVSTPGEQQSATQDIIMVTPVQYISKGLSSVVWSVSVPICGKHGLAALQHPTPSLARLLAQYKCCGKCSTAVT
jgi:hypothetical protein